MLLADAFGQVLGGADAVEAWFGGALPNARSAAVKQQVLAPRLPALLWGTRARVALDIVNCSSFRTLAVLDTLARRGFDVLGIESLPGAAGAASMRVVLERPDASRALAGVVDALDAELGARNKSGRGTMAIVALAGDAVPSPGRAPSRAHVERRLTSHLSHVVPRPAPHAPQTLTLVFPPAAWQAQSARSHALALLGRLTARLPLATVHGFKTVARLTAYQAKALTPFEVGDPAWAPSVEALQAGPAAAAVVSVINGFELVDALLTAEGETGDVRPLLSPTPAAAFKIICSLFWDNELGLDLASLLSAAAPPLVAAHAAPPGCSSTSCPPSWLIVSAVNTLGQLSASVLAKVLGQILDLDAEVCVEQCTVGDDGVWLRLGPMGRSGSIAVTALVREWSAAVAFGDASRAPDDAMGASSVVPGPVADVLALVIDDGPHSVAELVAALRALTDTDMMLVSLAKVQAGSPWALCIEGVDAISAWSSGVPHPTPGAAWRVVVEPDDVASYFHTLLDADATLEWDL